VRLAASVLTTGTYENQRDITGWEVESRAAEEAYKMASLGPEDLDVVELHDAFTICEIIRYEGLGLCPPGEGGRLIDEGATELGGRIPVNPSGGLLSKGHPIGASGVAQVVEILWHLRGEADKRQVENARVGMAGIMGGNKEGDTRACTVHILVKDQRVDKINREPKNDRKNNSHTTLVGIANCWCLLSLHFAYC
jgi:acetyl-CoA acetyltransferase